MKYGDLITVGLKAYDQRAYILEALEGVLAQTYRPIEIVISDDGSSDGTWEAIRERVERSGRDGEIVLNRNEANRGNMGNWLRICALSHGEWIVKCDGDDVSEPGRVEAIVHAVAGREDVKVVTCAGVKIDATGKTIGNFKARSAEYPFGACMAFHRDCYEKFPLPQDGRNVDDEVFARRALMLGGELRLDVPLVRYRVGTGVSGGLFELREPELRCMRKMAETFRQSRQDAETLASDNRRKWLKRLDAQEKEVERFVALRESSDFAVRWRAYREFSKPRFLSLGWVKCVIYLLPQGVGDRLLAALAWLRYRFRV